MKAKHDWGGCEVGVTWSLALCVLLPAPSLQDWGENRFLGLSLSMKSDWWHGRGTHIDFIIILSMRKLMDEYWEQYGKPQGAVTLCSPLMGC